jgi:hypothetical protein
MEHKYHKEAARTILGLRTCERQVYCRNGPRMVFVFGTVNDQRQK